MTNKQLGKERYAYSKVKNRYVLPYAKDRVKDAFISWTYIMRPNVLNGPPNIQKSL